MMWIMEKILITSVCQTTSKSLTKLSRAIKLCKSKLKITNTINKIKLTRLASLAEEFMS